MEEDKKLNFEVVKEDLYKFIDPNLTSEKNGIIFFNADIDDKTKDLVYNMFKEDIDFFNYKF